MIVVTWNVNSLPTRLNRVVEWIKQYQPDVLCLQELKLETAKFPHDIFNALGYTAAVHGQKTYNGVAIISKLPMADITTGIPGYDDPAARVVTATIEGMRIVCAYVVNGQSVGSEKFEYKMRWLRECTQYVKEQMALHPDFVFLGDFNIAPEDRDVHDPAKWEGEILCSDDERAFFDRWLNLGLKDSFRLFDQPPNTFSWWDYRMLAFPKNHGLRIDHIMLSAPLAARCAGVTIDRNERKVKGEDKPSDHAPVVAVIN